MSQSVGIPARGNWFALVAYTLLSAATQLLWLTFAPITTESAQFYGVDEGQIGILSEIFPFVYVVLAIPTGLLLDRWFRPALALGAVLTGVGGIVRLLGGVSFTAALAGQVLIALAQPLVLNAITRLSVEYLPKPQRATGIAVASAGLFLGMGMAFVSGAVLGGLKLSELLGIQAAFAVGAVLLTCVAVSRPGRFGSEFDLGPEESLESTRERPLRTVWADRTLRLLVLLVAVGFGVFVALTTWLQALLAPSGVSESSAGVMLLVMVLAGVAGAAILPPLAARHRNQPSWMLLAVAVAGFGCLVLAVIPGLVSGLIVSFALGFMLLAMLPIVLEIVEMRAGPAAATATSLVWLAGNAGGLIVAVGVQLLVGMPPMAFALMAVVPWLFGIPLAVAIKRSDLTRSGPRPL